MIDYMRHQVQNSTALAIHSSVVRRLHECLKGWLTWDLRSQIPIMLASPNMEAKPGGWILHTMYELT